MDNCCSQRKAADIHSRKHIPLHFHFYLRILNMHQLLHGKQGNHRRMGLFLDFLWLFDLSSPEASGTSVLERANIRNGFVFQKSVCGDYRDGRNQTSVASFDWPDHFVGTGIQSDVRASGSELSDVVNDRLSGLLSCMPSMMLVFQGGNPGKQPQLMISSIIYTVTNAQFVYSDFIVL
jgi:hypothetical protein